MVIVCSRPQKGRQILNTGRIVIVCSRPQKGLQILNKVIRHIWRKIAETYCHVL